MAETVKQYWCWVCRAFQVHAMETEEVGRCKVCGNKNWAPTGNID